MIAKIYIYLVSFATLMMVIGGGIGLFSAIANIVAPTNYYMSYSDYVQTYHSTEENKDTHNKETLSKEAIQLDYEQYMEKEKEVEKTRNINSLIHSFGWILIPLPIFFFMQRRIRVEKEEKKTD